MRHRIPSTFGLATLFAGAALIGCYGTPRTTGPDVDGSAGTGLAGAGGSSGTGGNAGAQSMDGGPDSSSCVDTTSDSKNCGACGHDCLGGTCSGGACQAVLIARYLGNPVIIGVGADSVYLTTDIGYVGRARKDGSDLKPFAMPGFASSAFIGTFVAEDRDRVFLSRFTGSTVQLSYCPTSGCDAEATAFGGPYSQYFAVDNSSHKIFWIDYSPTQIWAASTVGTVSGSTVPGAALTNGASYSRLLYAQGGLYFADGNAVRKLPAAGGSLITVTLSSSQISVLGTNSSRLFVYDGSAIGYAPLPNGTGAMPAPLIVTERADSNVDGRFAADDTAVYWIVNHALVTCEIANCSATIQSLTSATGEHVTDVGIDDHAIFWAEIAFDSATNTGASTVWRLAK